MGTNEDTGKSEVLLNVNETQKIVRSHSFCVSPVFTAIEVHYISDSLMEPNLSFIQQFYKEFSLPTLLKTAPVSIFPLTTSFEAYERREIGLLPVRFHFSSLSMIDRLVSVIHIENDPYVLYVTYSGQNDVAWILPVPSEHGLQIQNYCHVSSTVTITFANQSILYSLPQTSSSFVDCCFLLFLSFIVQMPSCPPDVKQGFMFYRHVTNTDQIIVSDTGTSLLIRHCSEQQVWEDVLVKDCDCPSVTSLWGIEWPQTHSNSMVTKPCPDGYTGTVVRWCTSRCAWNSLEGSCVMNQCPEELAENVLWEREEVNRDQVKYCANGRDIAFTRHCALNGIWEPVEYYSCTCPEETVDGIHWMKGHSNQYSHLPCPAGYNGSIIRRCDRFGRWMPAVYECSVKHCPSITLMGHTISESLEGTRITWPCDIPLAGYISIRCLEGGRWSSVEDHCLPVNCDMFLSGDTAIDSTRFVYTGSENVTRTTVELIPTTTELVWSDVRKAGISRYNSRKIYDVILRAYAENDIEYVAALCIVRSTQLNYMCHTMDAPFLEKLKMDKKGGMVATIGFVYPPCRFESPPDFNVRVMSVDPCPVPTIFSLRFSCTTLVNECRVNTVGRYVIRSGLRSDCSYSVSVELLTKSESVNVHHWSPPLLINPFSPCSSWKPLLTVTPVSVHAVRVEWAINTTDPGFFLQTVLIRKRNKATRKELQTLPWASAALTEVCSGEQSCSHMNSVLVPIETVDVYHEIDMKFEAGCTMCDRILSSSLIYYASPQPQVSLLYEVYDTYLVLIPQNISMISQLRYMIRNTLGELVYSGDISIYPNHSLRHYVSRLNPNSRYMVQWNVIDILSYSYSDSFIISTLPIRLSKLVFSVVTTARNLVTLRLEPDREGMLVCLSGQHMLTERDNKFIQMNGSHMGIILPSDLVLKTLEVEDKDTVVSCLQMDKTESFVISSIESVSFVRNRSRLLNDG